MPNPRKRIKVACLICKKELEKRPCEIRGKANIFCSRKCLGTWNSKKTGIRSNVWKGEDAKYVSIHAWINRILGKATRCSLCGAQHPKKKYNWANKDHKYRRYKKDYFSTCVRCHRLYDVKNNNYKMFGK